MNAFQNNALDALERRCAFYSTPAMLDNPFHPAGFKGTWAITDHKLIPDMLRSYLQRHFGVMRLNRVPLVDINSQLNSVWTGPGSLETIFREEYAMQQSGREIKFSLTDLVSVPTVEEDDDLGPLSQFGMMDDELDIPSE